MPTSFGLSSSFDEIYYNHNTNKNELKYILIYQTIDPFREWKHQNKGCIHVKFIKVTDSSPKKN